MFWGDTVSIILIISYSITLRTWLISAFIIYLVILKPYKLICHDAFVAIILKSSHEIKKGKLNGSKSFHATKR